MKKAFLIGCAAVMLAVGSVGLAAEAELAAINIPEVSAAPALDGKLDDACWRDAVKVERFYLQKSDQPLAETIVRLARDDRWLYLGAECKNPRMGQVRQRVFAHGGPVFTDDSLSIFISPNPETKALYEFALSFANVQYDKRFNAAGVREDAWSAPWRSATQKQEDGWTAELAIPLFVLESDDLGGMRLNLTRVFMEVILDEMNAFESDRRVFHALRPAWSGSAGAPENLVAVSGMGGFKPEIPFVPRIIGATAGGYARAAGRLVYGLEAQVASGSPVAGKAELLVLEERAGKTAVVHVENIELSAWATRDIVVQAPADDFAVRNVVVRLVECGRRENVLAETALDTRSLTALNRAYIGRSYVTTEPMPVRLEFGLSPELLKELRVAVDVNSKPALDVKALQPALTLEIPLDKLNEGENAVLVRLLEGEKELARRELTARRLAPRPGYEVKMDFIKGIILKDGQPCFPVGIFAHFLSPRPVEAGETDPTERVFKFLGQDIGLNTLVRLRGTKHLDCFMELAGKYGMDVISWAYPKPDDLRGRLKDASFSSKAMPLEERRKIWRGWYEELEPPAVEETKYLRERRNFLFYYSQDEANLPPRDYRIALAEWYWKTVTPIDPYRSLMQVYAREIPLGDNWTRWCDILGYNVFPNAHADGSIYNEPGAGAAYYASELRERCRQDNKVMWFAPFANLIEPSRQQVGMSKAHILCQAYGAIIYGARMLLYFALPNVVGPDAWEGLRTISAQVKAMSPALLNGDIAQNISYPGEEFLPRERKIPMVNAAVFRYPEGGYLLLAANVRDYAAQTSFKVAGVKQAERLFENEGKLAVADGVFKDKLEPYGVRAYRINLEGVPECVDVEVSSTALKDERAVRVDIAAISAQLFLGKNHVANPCFRQQTNPGVPDFYKPNPADIDAGQKGSAWFVDDGVLWEGIPSLFLASRMFGVYYPPAAAKPAKMTFSFYARSDRPDASVGVTMLNAKKDAKSFRLTADWKRYQFSFDLTSPSSRQGFQLFIMRGINGAWVNGLQLETGEEATEFQDDSSIVKKK